MEETIVTAANSRECGRCKCTIWPGEQHTEVTIRWNKDSGTLRPRKVRDERGWPDPFRKVDEVRTTFVHLLGRCGDEGC